MAANPVFIDPQQHWLSYRTLYLEPMIPLMDEARIAKYKRDFENWRLNFESGYKHTPKPSPVYKVVLDFDDAARKAEYRMTNEVLFEIPYTVEDTSGRAVVGDVWPGYTPERRFCGQGDDAPDGTIAMGPDGKPYVKKSFRSIFTYEYYEAA